MFKEVRESWEKLTGIPFWYEEDGDYWFKKDDDVFIVNENGGGINYCKYKSWIGEYIPQKWHHGIYEIGRGNIFWKNKDKTKYFNFFIDMDETNLNGWLEHFEFMKNNLKDDEDDKHITYKESVIEWILKYKFRGDDVQ